MAESREIETDIRPLLKFSDRAIAAYATRLEEYETDLAIHAVALAKREGDDYVSQHHVENAAKFLGSSARSQVAVVLGNVGGVMFGTGLGALLAFMQNPVGAALTVVAGVITAVGLALFARYTR